jgi:hypothetical protein
VVRACGAGGQRTPLGRRPGARSVIRVVTEGINATVRGLWTAAARPIGGTVWLTLRVERYVWLRMEDELGRLALAIVDRVLSSPVADESISRVLVGGFAARGAGAVLSSPLVEDVADDLVRFEVLERVTRRVLAGDTLDRVLDTAEAAGVPERVAERLLVDGIAEQVAARLLAGPELERIVERATESEALQAAIAGALETPGAERVLATALDSPGVSRMVSRIVESRVVEEAVSRVVDEVLERLPRTDGMWVLVDEIATSPAVMDAISHQGATFADEVAGGVRDHSRSADAKLERAARRLLRRRPRPEPGAPSTTGAPG